MDKLKLHYSTCEDCPSFCGRSDVPTTPTWAVSKDSILSGQYTCKLCRRAIQKSMDAGWVPEFEIDLRPSN